MELFREEYLAIQDDYLRVDPSEAPDDDVDYSNDDLGENTEITPLGDAVDEDEVNDMKISIDPDDDDDYGDDQDVDIEEEEYEDEIVDIKSQIDPDDEDDLIDDDDDLLDDDDDLDTSIAPDLDDDDDLLADDDDDLLADDDDIDDDDETTARTSIDTNADFSSRPHGRTTGTMLNHEPGLPGSGSI
jgi:hypothetical protein